eukprot:1012371-Rhodomonas_salina.1
MEAETEEHMLASSSESEHDDDEWEINGELWGHHAQDGSTYPAPAVARPRNAGDPKQHVVAGGAMPRTARREQARPHHLESHAPPLCAAHSGRARAPLASVRREPGRVCPLRKVPLV